MLCTLAVQHNPQGSYELRVTGNTASGPSGTGGQDIKQYPTADALFQELDGFGLGDDVTHAAARALETPEARKRFVKVAVDAQIPFDVLEKADIYLFDLG